MGIKDLIKGLGSKQRDRKQLIRQIDDQMRAEKIVEERTKSANERELERFYKEEREEQIKVALDHERKKRESDIKFNHNPLNVKNITNHTDWEVLKERNQFANQKNMFVGQPSCLKNNPNLFKTNNQLMNNGNVLRNTGGYI